MESFFFFTVDFIAHFPHLPHGLIGSLVDFILFFFQILDVLATV